MTTVRMTIDDLARTARCTVRNVRNYQTLGLLPPPELGGRVGYYDEGHLGRLRLIARLQEQGFSLAGIRELVTAWDGGRSLGDVLGFEEVLTAPWSDEQPGEITLQELVELFPEGAANPELGLRGIELGLIEPAGDRFRVPSPAALRAGAELVAVGVPLAATQQEFAALRDDLDRIAARLVALFDDHVWRPFVEAGMPREDLARVTEALRRMRPLVATTVQALLARAMEQRTAASTAAQLRRIAGAPPAGNEQDR
ncbi:MAG: MerR family transcriptional regulator [Anaerolineales bacterium]